MKEWNAPELITLDLTETAGNDHQSGNSNGKRCQYNGAYSCNSQGNGKGVCNGCSLNPYNGVTTPPTTIPSTPDVEDIS